MLALCQIQKEDIQNPGAINEELIIKLRRLNCPNALNAMSKN